MTGGADIDNVSNLLAHLLNPEKVLSAQHAEILFSMGTLRKLHDG